MNKKRLVIICSIVAAVLIVVGVAAFFIIRNLNKKGKGNGKLVYVENVGDMIGGSLGLSNRYMGIVESQEIKSVEKDANKTVGEIFVEEGDIVKKGDQLFSYDTESMQMDLEQLKLELQSISNTIASLNASVKDYADQRAEAPDEDKKEYTAQINSTNAQIAEEKYNYSVKEKEISRAEESIKSAVVVSPMDGVVKSIKEDTNAGYSDPEEGSNPESGFINIMAAGEYRIKGTATEESITSVTKGMSVIIHSRTDENMTWKGTISSINLEPEAGNGDSYGYGESSSKYSFYVEPENIDNLILGQHLYIEPDFGQSEKKEGIYLPSYYILNEESGTFVWKKDEDDRITKAPVTLGEYDEDSDLYEIVDGLTEEDYIAYPDVNIEEGNETTTNYEDVTEEMPEGEIPEGEMPEGEMPEGEIPDDGALYDDDGNPISDEDLMPDAETVDDEIVDDETGN